tara:strand:- start:64279 stop:64497 length:219 start_codon:yes stop_codon:yes gene_type:complete
MKIKRFNEQKEHPTNKTYTKDEVIELLHDFHVYINGWDYNNDVAVNFDDPNGDRYVDKNRMKDKAIAWMRNK